MAIKNELPHDHSAVEALSPAAAKRAAQLAPPEEQGGSAVAASSYNNGKITVDTSSLKLPRGFLEEEEERLRVLRPDPAVIVILGIAIAFISFIAYLISIAPPKQ